jgi:hypothetical protein
MKVISAKLGGHEDHRIMKDGKTEGWTERRVEVEGEERYNLF